jgi:hypothetical protein
MRDKPKTMASPVTGVLGHFAWFALAAPLACSPFKDDLAQSAERGEGGVDSGAPEASSTTPAACDPSAPFGAPVPVPGMSAAVMQPSVGGEHLSPDSLTAYFHAGGRPDALNSELYVTTRQGLNLPFGPGISLGAPIDTLDFDQWSPTVSGDGLTIVFSRTVHGIGNQHPFSLYLATRSDASAPFGDPVLLDNLVDGADPYLREDGMVLYFTKQLLMQGASIYRAARTAQGFDTPTPVTELNTTFIVRAPVISPDELTIYFGTAPSYSAPVSPHVATRATTNDPFGPPAIVAELASFANAVFVTADGCTLYLDRWAVDAVHPGGADAPYVAVKPPLNQPAPDALAP